MFKLRTLFFGLGTTVFQGHLQQTGLDDVNRSYEMKLLRESM